MESEFDIKKILVTTDFSGNSQVAFPKAIVLARKFDASILLLHVIQPVITPSEYTWGVQPVEVQKEHENNCHQALEKQIKKYFPDDLRVTSRLVHGLPFKEIIETCRQEKADLIVLATHGLTGLNHIIFGSTAEKVVRKSVCPVLVVRDPSHKYELP